MKYERDRDRDSERPVARIFLEFAEFANLTRFSPTPFWWDRAISFVVEAFGFRPNTYSISRFETKIKIVDMLL